ncbi:MAG: major facilitator superfamily MFS_1 [Candidatus Parvarchaeum acidiphilum ARMAN-4]|uniref:Major facilitator superfamily MFS_1 n=1 Tax=Candidatus Parvarchaeum acidiphilum ARMAN-4 TaxID=662760 RepID=D2EGG6_PARA4|nr:MAG: major facilitator superfamily MFS_1 [Candidatus Parvarchaeum acidiphilum ARMAN-4]
MIKNKVSSSGVSFVRIVLTIMIITFSIRASNNMLTTSVPLLVKYYFGFSETEVGLIAALLSFTTFLTTALLNAKLSANKRRIAFIGSNFVYMLVFFGIWVSNFYSIWILAAVMGVLLGFIMPNIITAAGLFKDPKTRDRVLSIYTVVLSFSLIIGPLIESELLKFVNIREAFLIFALFGLISFVLSPFMKFPVEKKKKIKIKVFSNYGFRSAIFNIMAYNIPFAVLIAFAGIYEKDTFDVSLSFVTLVFSLFFLTSFLSRIYLSFKPPRNIKFMMNETIILTLIGIIIMVFSRNLDVFLISFMILGIPHGFAYPTSIITLGRSFNDKFRNAANSYFFAVMMAVGVILPTLSGFSIDKVGFKLTFIFITLLILVLLVLNNINFRKWKLNV